MTSRKMKMRVQIQRVIDTVFNRPASFRVVYKDGHWTRRLRRSEARSLQRRFGGRLLYDPPEFASLKEILKDSKE